MRRLAPFAALALALACRSSAPYTVPSALINTALAGAVGAQQRAAGGCWATCAYGTACNERSGLCERAACPGGCEAGDTCVESGGAWRCAPTASVAASVADRTRAAGGTAPGEVLPGVGVSPATGSVPTLPPAKAAPDAP
jgi:hypothetical protein